MSEMKKLGEFRAETADELKYLQEEIRNELDRVETEFLFRNGWGPTCSLPGAMWFWQKEVDGKTVVVTKELAIHMQWAIEFFRKEKAK